MGRIITVASGKGGVGKSTVSVGLACALCGAGVSVLLCDADEGMRCLDLMLGVSNDLVFDMGDVISGARTLDDAVYPVGENGLFLLAAPNEIGVINAAGFGNLLQTSAEKFDYVIVDCPAGLDDKYFTSLPKYAEPVIVCTTDGVSVRDAAAMAEKLREWSFEPRLIINRFEKRSVRSGLHKNIDAIMDETGTPLLAVIPEDGAVPLLQGEARPLITGRAAMALHRAAARLRGTTVPLFKPERL